MWYIPMRSDVLGDRTVLETCSIHCILHCTIVCTVRLALESRWKDGGGVIVF